MSKAKETEAQKVARLEAVRTNARETDIVNDAAEAAAMTEGISEASTVQVFDGHFVGPTADFDQPSKGSWWVRLQAENGKPHKGYISLVGTGSRLFVALNPSHFGLTKEVLFRKLAEMQRSLLEQHNINPAELEVAGNGTLKLPKAADLSHTLMEVMRQALATHLGLDYDASAASQSEASTESYKDLS